MGSRWTGTLCCALLLFSVSTAPAEGRDWSVGYVVQSAGTGTTVTTAPFGRYPNRTFIELMSRPFAPLAVSSVPAWNAANREFRRPRPDYLLPKAFRRPEQVTVGFSFRF